MRRPALTPAASRGWWHSSRPRSSNPALAGCTSARRDIIQVEESHSSYITVFILIKAPLDFVTDGKSAIIRSLQRDN